MSNSASNDATPTSEATTTSTTSGPTGNRQRNTGRGGNKKKGKTDQVVAFKGACSDFDGVFITSDEVKDGKECNFKKVMLAAEVYVASTCPRCAKIMNSLFEEHPTQPSLTRPTPPVGDDAGDHLEQAMYM